MPRKRAVDSLQLHCMTYLAKNFEKVCYGLQETQMFATIMEDEVYLRFTSPFKDLPSAIVDEFFEVLCEKRTVSRHMLHMLFNDNNRTVRLRQGMGEIYYAIRFLTERCKYLTVLDLSSIDQMSPNDLLKLFEPLRHLVQVNLRGTLTVTEVVATIAKNCPELMELNLSETPVTDKSIVALCRTKQTNNASLKHAQKLRRLILDDVTVTPEAVAIALDNLPCLCDVEYHNVFRALECLPQYVGFLEGESDSEGVAAVAGTKLQLTRLQSTGQYISPESMEAALASCPYIQSVTLTECPALENTTLMKLLGFEKLTQMSITNDEERSLDFFEGIVPVLQVRGRQLQNLILSDFLVIDIDVLASTCPNLQNLALSGITDFIHQGDAHSSAERSEWSEATVNDFRNIPNGASSSEAKTFQHLKALEVWSAPGHPGPSRGVLQALMGSATKLQHLLIQGCLQFDDRFLAQVLKTNPMTKLSHFTVNESSITSGTLFHLLDMENVLDMIRVWSCPGIDKPGFEAVQKKIKEDNMEIYFDWYR